MLIYRDGSCQLRTPELLHALRRVLQPAIAPALGNSRQPERDDAPQRVFTDALLRAGAIECGLEDAQSSSARVAASLTDAIADAWLDPTRLDAPAAAPRLPQSAERHLAELEASPLPSLVRISPPEGFSYYALQPVGYAEALPRMPRSDRMIVIGLRTIGSTLSAVVAAAARARGIAAERFTVRPQGHPFDRRTEFTADQRRLIDSASREHATFAVVDEGPGLSGSSLLSVADALMAVGVPVEKIAVFCAYEPDVDSLRAADAARRWRRLRVLPAQTEMRRPHDAGQDWSAGEWRRHLLGTERDWPAGWSSTERVKFISRDGSRLYKFEGLGPYGEPVLARASLLAEAGFSPGVEPMSDGFAAYRRVRGRPMSPGELDADVISYLAQYCAFRATDMKTNEASIDDLDAMLRFNASQELGEQFDFDELTREISQPVIADSRLLPHEFVRDPEGRIWKTDAASHGDDHFFPGPTDIAWDLAGAIVEWQMPAPASHAFLAQYARLSGDDTSARLPFYLASYAAFRAGFCRMAAEAWALERTRLNAAAAQYRAALLAALPKGQPERALLTRSSA